jgi:hypothetical protein
MAKGSGDFFTPENLKKWAIELSNACGGAKVIKSRILVKPSPIKANELLDKFAVAYNNAVTNANEESKEEE